MNARSTSQLLHLIGTLNPKAWDAIFPHGPRISIASREYLIAMAIKGFASELGNRAVIRQLAGVQKKLATFAGSRMAAEFYRDDDWCGNGRPPRPGPHPFGLPFEEVLLNPQPLPPKELQREIGGYMMMLSEVTTLEDVAKDLGAIGRRLAG